MDSPLQVKSSRFWEFEVPHSNAIILRTKNIFWVFYSIYVISIKFQTFPKKKDCHSQCISKLTIVQELIRQLTKKHIVRTSFDTQQVKGSQALVKPSWEHFYHILQSLSGEIHGLLNGLLNTSILFGIVRNCHCLFRCNYLRNKKSFFSFSYPLWNLHQILNIFKRKKIVTANVFPKLTTV